VTVENPEVGKKLKNGALCIARRPIGVNAEKSWVVLAYWDSANGAVDLQGAKVKREYVTWICKAGDTFWGHYFLADRDGFKKAAADFEQRGD
jgi:hypothetical protein